MRFADPKKKKKKGHEIRSGIVEKIRVTLGSLILRKYYVIVALGRQPVRTSRESVEHDTTEINARAVVSSFSRLIHARDRVTIIPIVAFKLESYKSHVGFNFH